MPKLGWYASALTATILLLGQLSGLAAPANLPLRRKLNFPAESVGMLFVLPQTHPVTSVTNGIAAAAGQVTVNVPAGYRLIYEPNQRCFLKPQLLDQCDFTNVQALKVGFLSMDSDEGEMADRLLKHLRHLENIEVICVKSSDVTDAGLRQLPIMPNLHVLTANASRVAGTILSRKDFAAIDCLDLSDSTINDAALALLPKMPRLNVLTLRNVGLNAKQLAIISKCRNLEYLYINENPKIDDSCVEMLNQLPQLVRLKIQQTGISERALLRLRLKQLNEIGLPKPVSSYSPETIKKLKETSASNLNILGPAASKARSENDYLNIMAPRTKLPHS